MEADRKDLVEAPAEAASEARRPSRWAGALVGVVAGGVAVGVGQLAAGFVSPDASPVVVVGQAAIDLTPEWLKQWAIRTFGAQDKTVLLLGIGAVLLGLAIVLGVVSVRRPMVGLAGLGAARRGRGGRRPDQAGGVGHRRAPAR